MWFQVAFTVALDYKDPHHYKTPLTNTKASPYQNANTNLEETDDPTYTITPLKNTKASPNQNANTKLKESDHPTYSISLSVRARGGAT